jgi:hypothetical protein
MLLPGKATEKETMPAEAFFHKTKKMQKPGRRRSAERFDRMNWDRVSYSGKAAGEIQQKII